MIFLIFSTIFLVSPEDSVEAPFDLTLVFDPPVDRESIVVKIDNSPVSGEKKSDYFWREIKNIEKGTHTITAITQNEEKTWKFTVKSPPEGFKLEYSGNISIGGQNSYDSDTLYNSYTEEIYGGDLSFTSGERYLYLSLLHDPDYEMDIFPLLNYYGKYFNLDAGYLYPYLNELSFYSAEGYGFLGEIKLGQFRFKPFYLHSKTGDSIFYEYPRDFYGGEIFVPGDFYEIRSLIFYAEDDTSDISGFPIISPKKSLVINPSVEIETADNLSLSINASVSKGSENIYQDSLLTGRAFELSLIYEPDYNEIELGLRSTSENYLSPGNPYLYTGRNTLFLEGFYEKGRLSTNFSHSIYRESGDYGFTFSQSGGIELNNNFEPVIEFNWSKYPEIGGEEYLYGALGVNLDFSKVELYTLAGMDRTFNGSQNISYQLSSTMYWYPGEHSISAGANISRNNGNLRININVDSYIKLWNLGYLNFYYTPSFEEGYIGHLLRMVFEYDF